MIRSGEFDRETEAKFCVGSLIDIEGRLEALGGQLVVPRTLELNYRFDTPDGRLRRQRSVLRLRRDRKTSITYKGPSQFHGPARSRTELEVGVDDLDRARRILEALGFEMVFAYEKYRTTYASGQVEVMLDQLPYGAFVELEGTLAELRPVGDQLQIAWEKAVTRSYHDLFEGLRGKLSLDFRDLTFENFEGVTVAPEDLGVALADS